MEGVAIMTEDQKEYTVEQAAKRLKISVHTVRIRIDERILGARFDGRRYWISEEDIQNYLAWTRTRRPRQ